MLAHLTLLRMLQTHHFLKSTGLHGFVLQSLHISTNFHREHLQNFYCPPESEAVVMMWVEICPQDAVPRVGKFLVLFARPGQRVIVDYRGDVVVRPSPHEIHIRNGATRSLRACLYWQQIFVFETKIRVWVMSNHKVHLSKPVGKCNSFKLMNRQ